MPMVSGGAKLTMIYQDDDLATSRSSVDFPPATALADIQAYATSYAALIAPVSDCALKGYTITEDFYDDAYPLAAAGSDVEDKGVFVIRTANNKTRQFTWPGILESVLMNTISPPGTYVNLANAAISALAAALITGIAGTAPSTDRGDDFLSIAQAFKQNRGSQKSREYRG
jgi:hypothetical protein